MFQALHLLEITGVAAAVATRNQAAALQMGQASGFNLQLTPLEPESSEENFQLL